MSNENVVSERQEIKSKKRNVKERIFLRGGPTFQLLRFATTFPLLIVEVILEEAA